MALTSRPPLRRRTPRHTSTSGSRLQYLYTSPCYDGFLNRRFDKLLQLARTAGDPDRGEIIRLLLGSAEPGSHAHASLTCAQILLDPNKKDTEKMPLLWCTPNARELLTEWSVEKRWNIYLCFDQKAAAGDWADFQVQDFMAAFEAMRVAGLPPPRRSPTQCLSYCSRSTPLYAPRRASS